VSTRRVRVMVRHKFNLLKHMGYWEYSQWTPMSGFLWNSFIELCTCYLDYLDASFVSVNILMLDCTNEWDDENCKGNLTFEYFACVLQKVQDLHTCLHVTHSNICHTFLNGHCFLLWKNIAIKISFNVISNFFARTP